MRDTGRYFASVGMAFAALTMARDPGTAANKVRDAVSADEEGRVVVDRVVVDGVGKVLEDANIGGGNDDVDDGTGA